MKYIEGKDHQKTQQMLIMGEHVHKSNNLLVKSNEKAFCISLREGINLLIHILSQNYASGIQGV